MRFGVIVSPDADGSQIPFTFIILEARSKGMSQYLANYLVPIINGAR